MFRAWVDDLFHRYTFPAHTWSDGALDNNSSHRVEIHYLGASYMQSGPYSVSSAAFYEITETTDKDICNEDNTIVEQQQYVLSSSVSSPPISMIGGGGNSSSAAASTASENSGSSNPVNMLPPKKRRRHKVIRNKVVFCVDPPPASELHTPSPHLDYYLFPHDAVAGAVNDAPPFELVFSFHVPPPSSSSSPSSSMDGPHFEERRPTKLEEFAAVCSSANRMHPRCRSTDPGTGDSSSSHVMAATTLLSAAAAAPLPPMPFDDPRCKVVNMRISGVSRRLFVAIKQTVSDFETVCERMVQLMKYHTQQMAGQKGSISNAPRPLLTPVPPSPIITSAHDAEWEELLNSKDQHQYHHHRKSDACSSDDTSFDKVDMLVDPIPKNSHSNGSSSHTSASRAPISPRSASTTLSSNSTSNHNSNNNNNITTATTATTSTSKTRNNSSGGAVKKCLYCGSKSTPMWRRGPQGAGTLCNACGVKWKHGKILSGSTSTDMLGSSSNMDRPPAAPKERRGSSKSDKKRKKSTSGGGGGGRADRRGGQRSASATPVMETTHAAGAVTAPPSSSSSAFKSLRQQQTHSNSFDNNNNSDDDDMERNINAARNLSIREDEDEYHPQQQQPPSIRSNATFAVPWLPRDSNSNNSFASEYHFQQHQHHHNHRQTMTTATAAIDAPSLSSSSLSISGSYSPIESSPNSSPRLSSAAPSVVSMHHSRRHTMDVAMASKFGYSEASYPMSAGVDAVEAAALLTLLKRS
ncbi:hypothetical protein BDB00DRAFT_235179 [Zychaea mexicana]|uniref:uncharacterized protein n=1 Tax=Zychaea mexicana TaxID=64656 RepID=UPI0022FF13D1|nr:uncharacterized protein BDB00DRAFT_235179 [Zychaea mexicana]KAI9495482.1 hypothetical protein BDB00DRAFT_235179 [Zychaea mexicana]